MRWTTPVGISLSVIGHPQKAYCKMITKILSTLQEIYKNDLRWLMHQSGMPQIMKEINHIKKLLNFIDI